MPRTTLTSDHVPGSVIVPIQSLNAPESKTAGSWMPFKDWFSAIWTSKLANDWLTDFSVLLLVKTLIARQSALGLTLHPAGLEPATFGPQPKSLRVRSDRVTHLDARKPGVLRLPAWYFLKSSRLFGLLRLP